MLFPESTSAPSNLSSTGFQDVNKKINLQSTISKTRSNADVQPLYKDKSQINKPSDIETIQIDRGSTNRLGHMKDTRLLTPKTHLHFK